ncbi:pyridoxal phosphate-dependent decarboxylase family protein [Roseibium aggregatum]|uniref:pyridoxal phosphate-dependent decarboxylase family protein n=1 Tax=Roseibium aggregatum TaxID=187304 RepID=UPI001E537BF5|nr:pyridoxal-dependent decarboxylase [Roseibium aggregatum]
MSEETSPSTDLINGHVSEEQYSFLKEIIELGVNFLNRSDNNEKVINYKNITELKSLIFEKLPSRGVTLDHLLKEIKIKVIEPAISQSHKGFLAFPDTANSIAGLGADVLMPFINQNLIAIDRSAPSATMVELQVIAWLREICGYRTKNPLDRDFTLGDVGGMWTPGGNMSNFVAVLAALQTQFPSVISEGMAGLSRKPSMVLAKGIEHFSFPSAARVLGIGEDNIIWTKPNRNFTTEPNALRQALSNTSADKEPFIVICVAGNCRTTNIDSIRSIRKICDEFGVWLHVDACHGGSLLFSEEFRKRLDCIEYADSISIDPHKGLFVAYPSSYILFRDPLRLKSFCRYPEKFLDPKCLDLGLITPLLGSRGFHSLKLWALIKNLGMEGISRSIHLRSNLNNRMNERLYGTGLFTFLNMNDFYRQAFVLLPNDFRVRMKEAISKNGHDYVKNTINKYTSRFAQTLYERGLVCFDHFALTDFNDQVGLGPETRFECCAMAIGHCDINEHNENLIIEEIINVGKYFVTQLSLAIDNKTEINPEIPAGVSPASW